MTEAALVFGNLHSGGGGTDRDGDLRTMVPDDFPLLSSIALRKLPLHSASTTSDRGLTMVMRVPGCAIDCKAVVSNGECGLALPSRILTKENV